MAGVGLVSRVLRPYVVIPLVAILAGGGFAANSGLSARSSAELAPARATASCTVNVPSRVEVDRPFFEFPLTLGADCRAANIIYAHWVAKQADGSVMNRAEFRFKQPYTWLLADWQWLGQWTWHPAGAKAPGDPALARKQAGTPVPGADGANGVQAITLPQNTPKTDIRMKSTASLLAIRTTSTSVVSFRTNAVRYAHTVNQYAAWGGAKGQLQWRAPGTTTWNVLKDVVADASGNYNWSYTAPAGQRQYRVYYPSEQYIFGDESEYETV